MSYSERVQLPSMGILYGDKLPGGWVEIRPMTTREEKILLSPTHERTELMAKVIEKCVLTETIDTGELLVTDRLYLLFAIRNLTYGAGYQFTVKCPACHNTSPRALRIPEDLTLTALDATDEEPFKVTLPMSKQKLELRLLRVKDEEDIKRYTNQANSRFPDGHMGDLGYEYRLAKHVITIDGAPVTTLEAMKIFEEMHARDSLAMRLTLEKHESGLELNLKCSCSSCGNSFEQPLPMTAEFFRPSTISDDGPETDVLGDAEGD